MAGRLPSRDERALWRQAMRDVVPLARIAALHDGAFALDDDPLPPPPAAPAESVPPAKPRRTGPLPELAQDGMPGLDRRNAERLRRGELRIDGRLDLHGLTQEEAHGRLEGFLGRSQAAGLRCLLVITGKGGRRPDEGGGVLRNAVPRWLNEAPNRARLLAFAPARPSHGGGGALYVLLRRLR